LVKSILVPDKAYERLRALAEARGMGVEELVLSLALEEADPAETAEAYWEVSEALLEQAAEELEKGDLRQASEKIWGSAALAVKALAVEREGRRITSHGELWEYVARISREIGDADLRRLWQVANSMHVNYYEGWATSDYVEDALEDVRIFLDKLRRLREAGS